MTSKKLLKTGDFTIVGRGWTDVVNQTGTFVPHEVELPAITVERCREIAAASNLPFDEINDHHICLYKEGGGVGGCVGDSGDFFI